MSGGTLLVSRHTKCFPIFTTFFEELGYTDVHATDKDKDALNMLINEIEPRHVFVDSMFYYAATPRMMGLLLQSFPKICFVAVTLLNPFPDNLARWFIYNGIKSYIKLTDGIEQFKQGLRCIREGKSYVAPVVQTLINAFPEWPELKSNADRRQLEVLVMLCNGNSPDDIADCLHITRKTVDWHLEQLKKVFHAHNQVQLASAAFCQDVVTKEDLCFFSRNKILVKLPEWAECKIGMRNEKMKSTSSLGIACLKPF